MAIDVQRSMDFGGSRRVLNLPNAVNGQEPATLAQLNAAVEGLAPKDNVRVSTQGNINLAAPGAAIDGTTLAPADRVLVRQQTAQTENGLYVWNGAAVAMTRSLDANTFDELESAIVPVDEGTDGGTVWRQTVVNGVLGTNNVTFIAFGTATPNATTSSAGKVQLATQAEVDAGADALKVVTPATLAASAYATKKYSANIGDGSATSYVVTHNLGTRDVCIDVYRNSGTFDDVLVETQRTSINAITILFDVAPAANAYRVQVRT
jgi:hypothetical protein